MKKIGLLMMCNLLILSACTPNTNPPTPQANSPIQAVLLDQPNLLNNASNLSISQQMNALDAQTQALNAQLQQRHPDGALARELQLRREEIVSKQQLQTHLTQIGTLQNEGFSAWLYDLAQAHAQGIALQSFAIENDQLRLQGEAASNDAVPAWLSHFGEHPKLRNRTFSTLQVQRQKSGVLQFQLASKENATSAATGTAP